MPAELKIVKSPCELTEEQQQQLVRLHHDFLDMQCIALRNKQENFTVGIAQLFAGNRIGVVLQAGRLIGYCIYRVINNVLKLRSVYMDEMYRSSGFMTSLITLINEREEYSKAQLTVFKSFGPAVSLFNKLGFISDVVEDWHEMTLIDKANFGLKAAEELLA
ncbi:MAG: GNAT family N-acetyltransferase [Shewanella sp.]